MVSGDEAEATRGDLVNLKRRKGRERVWRVAWGSRSEGLTPFSLKFSAVYPGNLRACVRSVVREQRVPV